VAQTAMRTTKLPSGETVPVLGQGTWYLGEDSQRRADEIAALRLGLDLGIPPPTGKRPLEML
jgi:diketogulonate reductase-like aldo/keto reductase